MFTNEQFINIFGIASLATIIGLVITLSSKMDSIKQLRAAINKLKKSLDEMDEQAKLIVRTDMELNKTQEELNKKVIALYTLQRLSKEISTTLEEEQIFKMIEAENLNELGFEKALCLVLSKKNGNFILRLNIGYSEEELNSIKAFADSDKALLLELFNKQGALSSISASESAAIKEKILRIFKVNSFIISPISPKEGDKGILFVGTQKYDIAMTEGDEELITILGNQIGQALDNARLFEKTWDAHQQLEKEVEQRTRQLSAALEEVQRINKRKSDFVSSVSHELRTPLTSIKGYASILVSGGLGDVPEPVRQRLEKINRRSDELVQFINDLLDISRIESGRVSMKREPSNLNKIIEEISDTFSVLFKDKQIGFTLDIPPDLVILADANQINRVFINLVNNALKYTPVEGKITVQAKKVDAQIQVDVSDTGCGIPEEAQGKLFQEFYRVDSEINQTVKGTGLGLALVKNIVEAHNGKIWVKSRVGAGTTFSFTLPMQ